MDCLFCKIVAGDVPCEKIGESKNFFAFLDISPINKGHTLIVPKSHCKDFSDFDESLSEEWTVFIKEINEQVIVGVGAQGSNIGMNNGSAAGQAVFHQHTHIIPRFEDDELGSWPNKEMSADELKEVREQILKKKEKKAFSDQ